MNYPFAGSIVLDWTKMFRFRLQGWTSIANALVTVCSGNSWIATTRLKFLYVEVKPEGLTEDSPGRQHWDKDLIIFLALKGRYIIFIFIQWHCPSRERWFVIWFQEFQSPFTRGRILYNSPIERGDKGVCKFAVTYPALVQSCRLNQIFRIVPWV